MVPKSQIDQTIERFQTRTPERQDTEARLSAGSPLTANTPARVQQRLARIMAVEGARGSVAPSEEVATAAVTAPVTVGVIERVLGNSDLMSVTFLESAVRAAKTVARIRIRAGQKTIGYGTGSLIAPNVLMTNNHVLRSAAEAATSLAEFNYQDGIQTPTVFELDPGSFFVTDPALDYTLVAVRPRGTGFAAVTSFGFNRLIEQQGKILMGEALNIIQHPNGELKQVALRENELKDILPQFLHYHTDTAPGSSGSPVFNDQWELVALHHSGVPRTNAQGQYLTRDGTVWTPAMGEHKIDWIANEGARVSQIVAHLKGQRLTGSASRLRDVIFTAEMASPSDDTSPSQPAVLPTVPARVASDGIATWTIPIHVSIRVGNEPPATTASPTPPPAGPSASTLGPSVSDAQGADLQAALDAVEAARSKTYYDATRDQKARDAYYAGIDLSASPKALFQELSQLLQTSHSPRPSYKPAVHVYPFVDLHPDRKLRSIYSQKEFEPEELIREDFRIEQERAERRERMASEGTLSDERLAEAVDMLEAALPFNCEHVVPQSWFDKKEPMRGDLHHLFACEPACNSFRSNIPYFDFPDFEEAIRDECGKRDANRFEPSAAKGIVARATLYFLLRYPASISKSYDSKRLATLLSWHNTHPVTEYELHRNMAIFSAQGNRNPLIDHPDWADNIDFRTGL